MTDSISRILRKTTIALVAALLLTLVPVANHAGTITIGQTDGYNFKVLSTDADKFDDIMRTNAPAGTTVYIYPGIYQTKGVWNGGQTNPLAPPGFRVQNNTQIYGVSSNGVKPTLRLNGANLQGSSTENQVLGTDPTFFNGNIQLTNLTLDCNAQNLTSSNAYPMNLRGVNILGTNISLIGLDVINASHERTNATSYTENFIIALTCPATDGLISTNNLIKACTVSSFYNPSGYGACSAISLNKFPGVSNYSNGYIQGRVEDCAITLNGNGGEFAYNAHRTVSCVWSNNTATNANRGFNNDTPYNHNVVFQNNSFVLPSNVSYGLYLLNDTCWARIYENSAKCDLSGQSVWVCGGPQPGYLNGCTNVLFDHNTITVTGNRGITSYGFSLQPNFQWTAVNVDVENNLLHTNLANAAPASVGYYVRNTNANNFPTGVNLGWRYTPCRADLNQDANVDIVLQDASLNLATAFMTNGVPGPTNSLTPSNPGGNWRVVGSGDIDRDGRTDLFFQDSSTLDVAYWLLKDTYQVYGSLLGGVVHNPGGTWRIVATGDFNNDNKVDLLFQDASANLALWYLNGTSYQSAAPLNPSNAGSTNWVAVATGDFNNDGFDDILFQCNGTIYDGQLQVWFMNGANRTSSAYLSPDGTAQPNYRVAATGVFGTSGGSPQWNAGILFQDRTSGGLQMWYMNGTNRVATNNISAPPGSYKVVAPR
jgi:hypothetical protein